jgi:hypothetical protein
MNPPGQPKRPRPKRPEVEIPVADLARAVVAELRASAGGADESVDLGQSVPNWFAELLGALAPLKALAPVHGPLPKPSIDQLAGIQASLARVDLSDARPSTPSPCTDHDKYRKGAAS